jgi:hypothetical protein
MSLLRRLRIRSHAWVWLIGLAFVFGLAPIVVAYTVHDRCSTSDPACIFHSYTLAHTASPFGIGVIAAPAAITLILAMLLHRKVARRSLRAARASVVLATVSCVICFVGLLAAGLLMLAEAVLTALAVAATPLPPHPNDPLARSGPASP